MYHKIAGKPIDDDEYLDLVMPMYHLMEYSSNYPGKMKQLILMQILLILVMLNLSSISNTVAQDAPNQGNRILKNAAIAVPLKYLRNFWRSLEIALINCKWTKSCVFSANSNGNVNDNDNATNIVFAVKYTSLYIPDLTLSARDKKNLSKLLRI